MTRSVLAAILCAALLAGACGGTAEPKKPSEPSEFKTDSKRLEAAVRVTVGGALKIDYDARTTILIYRALDERIPLGLRLFSVGIPEPGVELRKGYRFRSAFDVLEFKGDGHYTIKETTVTPTGPGGTPLPSGIQAGAFVQIIDVNAQPPVVRYGIVLAPCSVDASREARVGRLSCPKLRLDEGNASVSIEMTWDAS